MLRFNIQPTDPSKTLSDEDIGFVIQQIEIAAAITAEGPPKGFDNWSEVEQSQYFQNKMKGYVMTPPTVGKCAWSVFNVAATLLAHSTLVSPTNFTNETLLLGTRFGARYMLALAVELALKHATISLTNSDYPRIHELDKLWRFFAKQAPNDAQEIRERYLESSMEKATHPLRSFHWSDAQSLDDVMKSRNNEWLLRYWFEPENYSKEGIHHGNNLGPLALAFTAIMEHCPENPGVDPEFRTESKPS